EKWKVVPMVFKANDRWEGSFIPDSVGNFEYTIEAWVDHFSTWQDGLKKKFEDHQDIKTEMLIRAELIEQAIAQVPKSTKKLEQALDMLRVNKNEAKTVSFALSDNLSGLMHYLNDKGKLTRYNILPLKAESKLALFS